MQTIKIKPVERYEVTHKSTAGTVEVVASNLTRSQALNVASAIHARAESFGMAVRVVDEGEEG